MKEDFNKICYNFQKQIVDIFNNQERIPFLLKYYLIKDIWENIENNKLIIDNQVRSDEIKEENVSTTIELSDEELAALMDSKNNESEIINNEEE